MGRSKPLKGAILADTKKEIVGIWTHWDGYGISAARAAVDMGRNEVIVTTSDGSPNTYTELRNLPTLQTTSGTLGLTWQWTGRLFQNLDKIFAGEPIKDQEGRYLLHPFVCREEEIRFLFQAID